MAVSTLKECVSGMKDILVCTICLEDVKEPRMLVCHHSFCTSCLKSIEQSGLGFQRKLQCPKCRKYTNVPKGIVNYLPMDCKLQELSELHRRASKLEVSKPAKCESQVSELVACVVCSKQKANNMKDHLFFYFCNNCHDYFCNACSEVHNDIALFAEHELVCLAGKSIRLNRTFCMDHSMKSRDYHCEECQHRVCSVCVATEHREHTVRPFEQYDKICRDKIDAQSLELYRVFHVPLFFLRRLSTGNLNASLMAHLRITTDDITKKIDDAAKAITEDIEQQRVQLTDSVKKQHSMIQNILTADTLVERCKYIWGSKERGLLLRENRELSEEVEQLFEKNGDDVDIPKLTADSELFVEFSSESEGKSIGSLRMRSLQEFISDNNLVKK